MHTEYLGPIEKNHLKSEEPALLRAAQLLQQGAVVSFPTETVYGLGASIFNKRAIQNIYEIKYRESTKALPIQLASLSQVQFVTQEVPPQFEVLARHFLPGPLTLVLRRHSHISPLISAGLDSIAVRFPQDPIAKRLIELTGCPLAVPSANLTGKPGARCAKHVLEDLNGRIHAIVDGGETKHGIESTILSLEDPHAPKILRLGALAKEEIENALGCSVAIDKQIQGKPSRFRKMCAKVRLFFSLEEIDVYVRLSSKGKRLMMGMDPNSSIALLPYFQLSSSNLYEGLRLAEREGYTEILVLCDSLLKKHAFLLHHLKQIAYA